MIAVIFEARPRPDHKSDYFDIATALRPFLDDIDGFISIERFESLTTPGKILSLSFWRDEKAIKAWRCLEEHRTAQSKGRARIFEDYRLRVAEVARDYGMTNRSGVPEDSQRHHDA